LPDRYAALEQKGADLIDDARALLDQALAHAMQRLQVELLDGLRGDELHRRALHRLGDRLRVAKVVLPPLGIGPHVLGGHQASIVPQRLEAAAEMMRPDTGLHADEAWRHGGEAGFHLAARPFLPQHDGAAPIQADDVERVLPDIDADHGNRSLQCLAHGVLLSVALPTVYPLSEQEHGRTIPLADSRTLARRRHTGYAGTAVLGAAVDQETGGEIEQALRRRPPDRAGNVVSLTSLGR
jgi:hypothetical protein